MKSFIFPKEVKKFFNIFLKVGDEIMLVGGCIRDYLLNKKINDFDFATKYKPDEIKNILEKNNISYFSTGEKFGTITAVINNRKFEITSLRNDIKTDGRRATVEFTRNYFEDAKRRDFTFNALYMDNFGKIYDFFNGLGDLKNKKIRFIGNAEERITEDNLRIFRFFRFYNSCAEYFEYSDLEACEKCKNLIGNLSKERITEEFLKILNINYCIKSLKIMKKIGILQEITGIKNLDTNLDNLEIFYSINAFINYKYNNLFILALILSKNKVKFDFALSNKEKKYINNIINTDFIINFNDNLYDNFCFEIKKLLFLFKNKSTVEDIIILNFCNKYKDIESFNNLKMCLEILKQTDIPELDIRAKDLVLYNFNNRKEFNKIIEKSRQLYINSRFKLSKKETLRILKNEGYN